MKLVTLLSLLFPLAILAQFSYPFDARNGAFVYYRCLGEYDKIYDFDTGGVKEYQWCEKDALLCTATKIIFLAIASNGFEVFLLVFAIAKILRQSENVMDLLNVNVAQNRRR